jgi:CRISPR-associated endonuclease/helicase Cas3
LEIEQLAELVFSKIFEINTPYPEQVTCFEEIWQETSSGKAPVTVLRLPTGYGKTESLVGPYFGQFLTNQWLLAPRIIYSLPTQALCNQVYCRMRRYVENVYRVCGKKLVVEVQHGGKAEDPYFIGDIVVTTFDQLLYGYARAMRHIHDRIDIPAGSISLSYVVLDEAHMYSPYTHALVKALLEILNRSNIPVSIATATMPSKLLNEMTEGLSNVKIINYTKGHVIKRSVHAQVVDSTLLKNNKLNEKVKSLIENTEKTLIVCNSVEKAINIWRQLFDCGFKPILVHSRFTPPDRDAHENEVTSILSKTGARKGVIVTTQVCEAGVDISADVLITECAPADALIQRSGRCARWENQKGEIYIFKHDSHLPYKEKFINTTWDYLQRNPNIDFANWDQIINFVDILPYSVDAILARESLNELYEATLYADSRPTELTAREESFVSICLDTFPTKQNLVNIPYEIANTREFKNEVLELQGKNFLNWDFGKRSWVPRDYIAPYRIYKGKSQKYTSDVGLYW